MVACSCGREVAGPVRILGPYKDRKGARLYSYEVHVDEGSDPPGKRHNFQVGVEDAYVDTVHVEADLSMELVEEVAQAYTYANTFNMGRQRIVGPIGKLIHALGLRHHTDEEIP